MSAFAKKTIQQLKSPEFRSYLMSTVSLCLHNVTPMAPLLTFVYLAFAALLGSSSELGHSNCGDRRLQKGPQLH